MFGLNKLSHCVWVLALFSGCASQTHPQAKITRPDPLVSANGQLLYQQALHYMEHSDWNRAEQYLLASQTHGMSEERVTPKLVDVCIKASRYRAALQYAEQFVQRHPDRPSMVLLMATLQMAVGELMRAKSGFEHLLILEPDNADGHYLYATLLRDRLAETKEASKHYSKYVQLSPDGEHAAESRVYMKMKP